MAEINNNDELLIKSAQPYILDLLQIAEMFYDDSKGKEETLFHDVVKKTLTNIYGQDHEFFKDNLNCQKERELTNAQFG